MAIAHFPSLTGNFRQGLDGLLYEVCEELQISPTRYDLAVERYNTLNRVLEGDLSPFKRLRPEIYPQGSMALGTTVKPPTGDPHDLDFVLQLLIRHNLVDPMALIKMLYEFLRRFDRYRPMVSLKNRCVRIEYADEFYMDVLPACMDGPNGGTCIKVPDCSAKTWKDSNPKGYIAWFEDQSRVLLVERMLEKAEPIPDQEAVGEKSTLQLAVQLLKRWRDIYYADNQELAPISIVLTTIAAHVYRGQPSLSDALSSILAGTIALIDASRRTGEPHLVVLNPSNIGEDLSERWDTNPAAYRAFEQGIRNFEDRWSRLVADGGNVNAELKSLFGETVTTVLRKRASQLQEGRKAGALGVTSAGLIASRTSANVSIRPNTFYGEE